MNQTLEIFLDNKKKWIRNSYKELCLSPLTEHALYVYIYIERERERENN